MVVLTSQLSPLRIAELAVPNVSGRLGMTICPGKKGPSAGEHHWNRDIEQDLEVISRWPARAVISLLEDFELDQLEVRNLGNAVQAHGMDWFYLEIVDGEPPDERFEAVWPTVLSSVWELLTKGENVVIHCRGGLGRTGTVAALVLREAGVPAEEAVRAVRAARPGAIETSAQEKYVQNYRASRFPSS